MKKALISAGMFGTTVALTLAQVSATITIGNGATQGQVNGGALISLLNLAQQIVSRLGIFAVGVALLCFFWFLINFIIKGSKDPAEQSKSLRGMAYSILALFVMVSIWGIIGLLGSIFGINQGGNIPIPGIPVPAN